MTLIVVPIPLPPWAMTAGDATSRRARRDGDAASSRRDSAAGMPDDGHGEPEGLDLDELYTD